MKSIFFIIAFIIQTVPISAMDGMMNLDSAIEQANKIDKNCYIASFPVDIQNEIAQYLTFYDREDEAEFIERTKVIPQGDKNRPISYLNGEIKIDKWHSFGKGSCSFIAKNSKIQSFKNAHYFPIHEGYKTCDSNHLFSCSPDCSTFIWGYDNWCNHQKFKIFNTKNSHWTYLTMNLDIAVAVAVSSGATHIALVIKTSELESPFYTLKIINTADKTQIFQVSEKIKSVAFNKQGTQVIIHYPNDEYKIFPISRIMMQASHQEKSKKTLSHYFLQRGVCKKLNS